MKINQLTKEIDACIKEQDTEVDMGLLVELLILANENRSKPWKNGSR